MPVSITYRQSNISVPSLACAMSASASRSNVRRTGGRQIPQRLPEGRACIALIPISGYHDWRDTPGNLDTSCHATARHDQHYFDLMQLAVIVRQGVNRATFSPEVQCNVRFLAFISLAGSQSIHGY